MKHNHLTTIELLGYAFYMNREKPASRIKSRLQALENDHTWRLWKTVYITIAIVLVVAAGMVTSFMNTRQQYVGRFGERYSCRSAYIKCDTTNPVVPAIIAGVGLVAAYYLVLPRVFEYLKGSDASKTDDMS